MSAIAAALLALGLSTPNSWGRPVPIEMDRWGRPMVAVHMGEAGPFRFLIDTGSTLTAVSPKLAARLGLPDAGTAQVSSLGATTVAQLRRTPAIRVGGYTGTLRWLREIPGLPDYLDGFLGQDFLGQMDYLLEPSRRLFWINPPWPRLSGLDGLRLPLRWVIGPLAVVNRESGEEWGIDSGASHIVLFKAGIGGRPVDKVRAVTVAGPRWLVRLRAPEIVLGSTVSVDQEAVLAPSRTRSEHGLLPVRLFEAVYVSNRARYAVVVPRKPGQRRRPDAAARLGAPERDAVGLVPGCQRP